MCLCEFVYTTFDFFWSYINIFLTRCYHSSNLRIIYRIHIDSFPSDFEYFWREIYLVSSLEFGWTKLLFAVPLILQMFSVIQVIVWY